MNEACIARTNLHNEIGRVQVVRRTPFRSPSNDVCQAFTRSNFDFQFMLRAADPDSEQAESSLLNPQLCQAMYGMRLRLQDSGLLRAIFQFLIAMFQAAFNCDFYITKYQAKPMQQLQNLLGHIRGGLERLEREEEELGIETNTRLTNVERARRVTLRAAMAANRSSWCSCCEVASFILAGEAVRKSYVPKRAFLARPGFLLQDCKRLLHRGHVQLLEAAETQDVEQV